MEPPLQAWLSLEQETSYCSEKERRVPVATKWAPSIPPVEENAQHEPQEA